MRVSNRIIPPSELLPKQAVHVADALPVVGPGHDQALPAVALQVREERGGVLLRDVLGDLLCFLRVC